jgi:hypothetical protein
MPLEQSIDLSAFSAAELAARLCTGLNETAQSEGSRCAFLPIPGSAKSRAVDAIAFAEADEPLREPGPLAMQIYLDGRPVGQPAREITPGDSGRLQATAGVALLVSPGEDVEVSAAIVSPNGGGATRVRLVLAFH